jgi:hypothetical protein
MLTLNVVFLGIVDLASKEKLISKPFSQHIAASATQKTFQFQFSSLPLPTGFLCVCMCVFAVLKFELRVRASHLLDRRFTA